MSESRKVRKCKKCKNVKNVKMREKIKKCLHILKTYVIFIFAVRDTKQ